ncbi:MAG: selenocysteine-specific translation elongation factor [Intrasporangium sp.]|uniref:selenocysteine-specific translation elongation factor n=1 Tax=Intrasporangium sp. TaxID=1925024 RepID=UPI00264783C8|nr:selenocysteine-specific translation elongation factor [Intrasporangium sp.]MDN5796194.1 selenocysteine-specific translation elongation factor [Intrasporangium sp.]
MHVVATAGHVDHGKSTLVHALTGMEPDRWAEERRRGLTIDLGYVWTTLPEVGEVAFVDVPGHRRFIGNMLAGLGPVPAVLFVVAADEGWREQSEEHLAAVDALGITHGLLAVTRSDLADPGPATSEAHDRLARSSLGDVPVVVVSGVTGEGLDRLRSALAEMCRSLPVPRPDGRLRLWVDRAFTVRGSGTVVTGTLGAGTVRVGDRLEVGRRAVTVRGVQSLGEPLDAVGAVARVAVNLRGVGTSEVHRGDALLTPGTWRATTLLDVHTAASAAHLPRELTLHVGTAGVRARLRPLEAGIARLTLERALPLETDDRAILRDPGADDVLVGAIVLDPAPPPLRRRGAAIARARDLARPAPDPLADEVRRRGHVQRDELLLLGLDPDAAQPPDGTASSAAASDGTASDGTGSDTVAPDTAGSDTAGSVTVAQGVRRIGEWFVSEDAWRDWTDALEAGTAAYATSHPLDPHPSEAHACDVAGIPDRIVLRAVADALGYTLRDGRVVRPDVVPDLGRARTAVDRIVTHLREHPFDAPEQHDLQAAGLGPRELAAAEALGRLLRLGDGLVVLPTSPARAMRILGSLPQPFTTSGARQALGTTRRVAIPLLEHLDRRGWTRRLDGVHRAVVTRQPQRLAPDP